MKSTAFILLLTASGLTFSVKNLQQKYLPVCIQFTDSSLNRSEFMLHTKAFFGTRKIKVISRDDAHAYSRAEGTRVREEYLRTGGKLTDDFAEYQSFCRTHMRFVANMLYIKITTDNNGIISDTISWDNMGLPINFGSPPRKNPKFMVLDSLNSTSLLKLSQSLVDSMVASGSVIKE